MLYDTCVSVLWLINNNNSTYLIQQWRRGWHKSQYWVLWMLRTQIRISGPLAYVKILHLIFLAKETKDDRKVGFFWQSSEWKLSLLWTIIIRTFKVHREDIQAAGRCHKVLRGTQTNSYRRTLSISSLRPKVRRNFSIIPNSAPQNNRTLWFTI